MTKFDPLRIFACSRTLHCDGASFGYLYGLAVIVPLNWVKVKEWF